MAKKKVSEKTKAARKKPGGTNAGKYKGVKSFCGPSGGAPSGSFPVNSLARAKSALKLAHNAPNPSGIKSAVYRKYPQLKQARGGGYRSRYQGGGMYADNTVAAAGHKFPSNIAQL